MCADKTIQYLLDNHYPDYAREHKQPLRVIKAIEAQILCRTKEYGSSYYVCPEDGETKECFHSCRNKGCTVCGEARKNRWLESQKERLLNCGHFHLVFTLPHEYQALWCYNRKWFINAQFKTSSDTLKDLLKGNKKKGKTYKGTLNADPGYLSTLHTWGRDLSWHPHIHILLTAGGLNTDDEWIPIKGDYLLPIKQVKALYRGKLQAQIKALLLSDEVVIPEGQTRENWINIHKKAYTKEWSVDIQEQYEQGTGVLIYLSRYLGSAPIKAEQIKIINHNKEVLFSYWSHREKKKKTMRLSIDEFLKKYLLHQAEPFVQSIRYYGLYASQSKEKRTKSRSILGKTAFQKEGLFDKLINKGHEVLCSCCGAIMMLSHVSYRQPKLKNPLYRREIAKWGGLEGIMAPKPSG